MDNPLLIIGALLAAYWYYSTYISPGGSSLLPGGTSGGTPITPAPYTPGQISGAVPPTAGPVLPSSAIPTFNQATSQWTTPSGQVAPTSFFQSGPTGKGLTPVPEWNSGIGGNKSATGWVYADGSIYFESGPAAGQASGPPASAWGGNSSMAALANGVPVSPNAVMQTINGA